jgi:hypothetical protein
LFEDDFDNMPVDCSCIDEGCEMYLSKNVGHFMLSCTAIGPFGIIATLYTSGAISLFGVISGFIGIFVILATSLVYMIRYHYNRRGPDDDDGSSDSDELEMENL